MIEKGVAGWTLIDTRGAANESVDKKNRYRQIIECLKERPVMTAKEIAVVMMKKEYIPTSERNFTAPRLTELHDLGVVDVAGKMTCQYTGRKVNVYLLRCDE